MRVSALDKPVGGAYFAVRVDRTSQATLDFGLSDSSDLVVAHTANAVHWRGKHAHSDSGSTSNNNYWDAEGHFNATSLVRSALVDWDFATAVDYEESQYTAFARNRNSEGMDAFFAQGDGTYGDEGPYW